MVERVLGIDRENDGQTCPAGSVWGFSIPGTSYTSSFCAGLVTRKIEKPGVGIGPAGVKDYYFMTSVGIVILIMNNYTATHKFYCFSHQSISATLF